MALSRQIGMRAVVLDRRPSLGWAYLRGLSPRRRFDARGGLPPLALVRHGLRLAAECPLRFRARAGGGDVSVLDPLDLVLGHHFMLFAHPSFPLGYLRLLAVAQRIVQMVPLEANAPLDLHCRIQGPRILSKGLEIDVTTTLSRGEVRAWEATHTYFLRTRVEGPLSALPGRLPPLADSAAVCEWTSPAGGGLRQARLSGDWNPVHWCAPWARLLGFRGAFCHTTPLVDACLARLPEGPPAAALALQLEFKGPVYYRAPLRLRWAERESAQRFDLFCGDEARPAIVGELRGS